MPSMVTPLDDLPIGPDGFVLARDVSRLHGERSTLARAVARGDLVRVERGAYIASSVWAEARPWERYRLRCLAVARARPDAVLCHAAAAAIWGIPLLRSARRVDVLAGAPEAGRVSGSLHYRGTRAPEAHIVSVDGVLVTDLARTLVELTSRTTFAEGVVAMDWASGPGREGHSPRVPAPLIHERAAELELVRGARRLAHVLSFADGRAASAGESLSRARMFELGFVIPELQYEFRLDTGRRAVTDFRWSRQRIVGEYDGIAKYRAAEFRRGRTPEQVVVEEKLREDALRREGEGVARWIWDDLWAPQRFASLLAEHGVPRA